MDDEFPYKKYYLNLPKLIGKARSYKPRYLKANQLPSTLRDPAFGILTHYQDPFFEINEITDYFTENCRVRCRVETKPLSPLDYYTENKVKLVKKLDDKGKKLTLRNLNTEVYNAISPCTNYKLTYLLGILRHFKPKRWLDMSAGWGDRLISACICNIDTYVGIDPSECNDYDSIIKYMRTKGPKTSYIVLKNGAETVDLTEIKAISPTFDFIFTSPPFFTFELYDEKNENQSTSKYDSIELWLTKFLFVTIDRAWELLENKGNYLLYIEDKEGYRFIDRMIEYIKAKEGSVYNGIIYQVYRDDRYKKKPYSYHTVYWFRKT